MCSGHICRYPTMEDGISAIQTFLTKAQANGHDTIEKLNCWYVQPCSESWLKIVIETQTTLENLGG